MFIAEPVESRRLLAATAVLSGSTLLIRGAEFQSNVIDVTYNADGVHLDVSIVSTPATGSPTTLTKQFESAAITIVKVRGGRGADSIELGTTESPLLINARVNGLPGADTITTGSGNDRIAGGNGYDVIHAGAGNDLVFGERGNDSIDGGDGLDSLWGGVGEDTINGGAGDDVIGCILGTNLATGGDGADKFVIKKGRQSQASDFVDGVDTYKIVGKASTDGSVPPPTA